MTENKSNWNRGVDFLAHFTGFIKLHLFMAYSTSDIFYIVLYHYYILYMSLCYMIIKHFFLKIHKLNRKPKGVFLSALKKKKKKKG